MIRYCLKPRTRAAVEREAERIASSATLVKFDRRGQHSTETPRWAIAYLSLPCVKAMTPAQARRDLAAHLKRWREEKDWGKGPGALDLKWKGHAENWS